GRGGRVRVGEGGAEAHEEPASSYEARAREHPPQSSFAYVHLQLGESCVIETEVCSREPRVDPSHLFSVAGRGLCLLVIDQIGLVPPPSTHPLEMDEFTVGGHGQVTESQPMLLNPSDQPGPGSDYRSSCWPVETELTPLRLLDKGHLRRREPVEYVRNCLVVDRWAIPATPSQHRLRARDHEPARSARKMEVDQVSDYRCNAGLELLLVGLSPL